MYIHVIYIGLIQGNSLFCWMAPSLLKPMYCLVYRKAPSSAPSLPGIYQRPTRVYKILRCQTVCGRLPPLQTYHVKPRPSLWEVKADIIQCIHLCFCMLAISFYFVNCVIISCKLSFNSRFTRNQIPIMSFLGFKKAELGCKMSELHLYVVKRQNWVVIIRK